MLLLAAIVGSGIMGERLSGGNIAIALLANTIATGATLVAIILALGGISGSHFNPAVTLAVALERGMQWREVPGYILVQLFGALAGVAAAHMMFGEAIFTTSQHSRTGVAQMFSEFIATFGLLSVIWGCSRLRSTAVPFCCWRVHHRGVLVYCLDIVCKSCSDGCPVIDDHVLRDSSSGCTRLCRCAAPGIVGSDGSLVLVAASATENGGARPHLSPGNNLRWKIKNGSYFCARKTRREARWRKAYCAIFRAMRLRYLVPARTLRVFIRKAWQR